MALIEPEPPSMPGVPFSPPTAAVQLARSERVKDAMRHTWTGYETCAFGADELLRTDMEVQFDVPEICIRLDARLPAPTRNSEVNPIHRHRSASYTHTAVIHRIAHQLGPSPPHRICCVQISPSSVLSVV